MKYRSRIGYCVKWIIVCGWFAALSAAETPAIRHVRLGIGGQFRDRAWNLVEVLIENPGQAREGLLFFEHGGSYSSQTLAQYRDVILPARSLYRIRFPVYLDAGTAGVTPGAREARSTGRVRLTDGARVEWDRYDVLARPGLPSRIGFLGVAEPFKSFNFLRELAVDGRKRGCERSPLRTSDLPRDTLALQPFDFIVLGDEGEQPLETLQREALLAWIRRGGVLVFTPGPEATDASLRSWSTLLPATYGGGVLVDEMPALPVPGGIDPFRTEEGILRRRLLVREGRVLAGSRENPLAVSREVGNGRVIALAFDAAQSDFQAWPGASHVWSALMEWPSPLERYALHMVETDQPLQGIMSHLAGVRVLNRRHITYYLLAVLGVLGGLLLGSRMSRHPERGWAWAAFGAVAMGIGAIYAAVAFKGEMTAFINEIGMVRAGEDGSASIQAAVSVFSPEDAEFDMAPRKPHLALFPGPSETRPPERFVQRAGSPPAVEGLRVRAHGVRHLLAHGNLDMGERLPETEIRVTAQGLHARIGNHTGRTMQDAFVRWNRLVLPLGDTHDGHDNADYARAARGPGSPVYSRRVIRRAVDEWRDSIRTLLFAETDQQHLFPLSAMLPMPPLVLDAEWRRPVLYYWCDQPLLPLDYAPEADRRAIILYALPTRAVYDSGELLLPKGSLSLELRGASPGLRKGPFSRFQGLFEGDFLLAFSLPEDCPDLTVSGLRVVTDFEGDNFRYHLAMVPADGHDADPMPSVPLAGRGPTREIADPSRFYHPATRTLLLSVRVEKTATEDASVMDPLRNRWLFRELDVELTGYAP